MKLKIVTQNYQANITISLGNNKSSKHRKTGKYRERKQKVKDRNTDQIQV